jgi:hypothetical protein
MYAFINTVGDDEQVTVASTMTKCEQIAMEFINDYINHWEGFDKLDGAALLRQTMKECDAESSMDLFGEIIEQRTEFVYIRICPVSILADA